MKDLTYAEQAAINKTAADLDCIGRIINEPKEDLQVFFALHVPSTSLSRVGLDLYHLDLEMRRAAAAYTGDPRYIRPSGTIAPIPVSAGRLEVVDIRPGSVDALLVPVGLLATMLTSDPASAFANAITFLDFARRLIAFRAPKQDLREESTREILNAAQELLSSRSPDGQAELPTSGKKRRRQAEYTNGNETVRGSTIVMVTEESHGRSRTIVVATGED